MVLESTILADRAGTILRDYIKREYDISSRLLRKLKSNFLISVNGNIALTNTVLKEGDVLRIDMDRLARASASIAPEDVPIDILYEDAYMIAISKQTGLIIHPSVHEGAGTIANGLARYFEQTGCRSMIHPISRLDRDTSGVVLFAKDSYTADRLGGDLRGGAFQKEYLGIARGNPSPCAGLIDIPLGRVDGYIMLRAPRCGGKISKTYYETLHSAHGMSLMLLHPITGRTHQLRAHLSAIGVPLLTDGLYGPAGCAPADSKFQPAMQDRRLIKRQALHSWRLTFPHPYTRDLLTISSKPPADFMSLMNYMGYDFERLL